MPHDAFDRFVVLFSAGLGLVLAGGANLLLRRYRAGWRVAATAVALGVAVAVVAALADDRQAVSRAAGLMLGGLLPAAVLGSVRLRATGVRLASFASRPAARWGAAAVAGLLAVIGSAAVYDAETERQSEDFGRRLELVGGGIPTEAPAGVRVVTDRGTPVAVRERTAPRSATDLSEAERAVLSDPRVRESFVRRGRADDGSNCHGWVFAAGRYWVPGSAVEVILAENGYAPAADPRPGDVAVYRDRAGAVLHTAVVRYAAPGLPPMVEGKWGAAGVFLHPADKSPYGADVTFYRSPRTGHTLAGIDSPAPTPDLSTE